MIRTIETDPISPFGPPEVPAAEWTYRKVVDDAIRKGPQFMLAWLQGTGVRKLPDFPRFASLEHKVFARINHGRWLWDCPRACGGAQCCTPNDPRGFCVECFNGGDGYYPVVFPDELAAIETLLSRRPRDDQRHWAPGETVDQLQLENATLGLPDDLDGTPSRYAEAVPLARAYLAEKGLGPGRVPLELGAAT